MATGVTMKSYVKYMICVLVLFLGIVPSVFSQDDPAEGLIDLDTLPLPKDAFEGDDVRLFSEEMITKEIDGEIDQVGEDFLIVRDDEEQQLKLLVDAETVIYINERKSTLSEVEPESNVFAFYVDENGLLKCDLLDISE